MSKVKSSVQGLDFPDKPGVYLFKDGTGNILYIGKATSLKHRVRSYFTGNKRLYDWKVTGLLQEYDTVDYLVTESEIAAALLEAELISAHQPKYNVLLKDGQPFVYILFTHEPLPKMIITRNRQQSGTYVGPFLKKQAVRSVYSLLLHTFQLNGCNKKLINGCLDFHIGTCPGMCKGVIDEDDYRFRMHLAYDVLTDNQVDFLEKIKNKITEYNKKHLFEKAQKIALYIDQLAEIRNAIAGALSLKKVSVSALIDVLHKNSKNHMVYDDAMSTRMKELTGINTPMITIDCFDISHFQSSYLVGSCVRFVNGQPDKKMFRKFTIKTLTVQNDYAALQEVVRRRYARGALPDLILIDGGKGQRNAIVPLVAPIPCISLAKREERLYSDRFSEGTLMNVQSPADALLISLRDYAHHFAVTYHRFKRNRLWLDKK